MKRIIALLLALMMCLSLCGCGEDKTPKLAVGETASTDIVDFTLKDAQFAVYLSPVGTNFVEPIEDGDTIFTASVGHSFVSMTFTLKNNDRGGNLRFDGTFEDWAIDGWSVKYNGEEYNIKDLDLNDANGNSHHSLSNSAIIHNNGTVEKYGLSTYILDAGAEVTIRTFGMLDVEPENLTDGFELTIQLPNSSGEFESFTYAVGQ